MSVVTVPVHGYRQAKLQCVSCNCYFDASAKRIRKARREPESALCLPCQALDRRSPVNVMDRHRRWWTDLLNAGIIDQQWIDETVGMIWEDQSTS